ncbi:MAG: HD domain-containing phosphohydrolase [Acidobacteriota bacterium]
MVSNFEPRPVIVLADEDEAEAGILRTILEKHNFQVAQATDGLTALDLAVRSSAYLVIAALYLPGLDGFQLCQKLHHSDAQTPCMLISPYGQNPDKWLGQETFAIDYVQRPVNANEFESRLKAILQIRPIKAPEPSIAARLNRAAEVSDHALPCRDASEEAPLIRKEAASFVSASMKRAATGETIDAQRGLAVVGTIIESLKKNNELLLTASDRSAEFSVAHHSINVAILASVMAQTSGKAGQSLLRICLAGMLHDIGTVKLPEKLIYKPGPLTAEERSHMRRRPIYSAEILSNVKGLEWLPVIVSQVCERDDGQGYPYGLRGKQISEEARLLGISDVLEARTHARPYRLHDSQRY